MTWMHHIQLILKFVSIEPNFLKKKQKNNKKVRVRFAVTNSYLIRFASANGWPSIVSLFLILIYLRLIYLYFYHNYNHLAWISVSMNVTSRDRDFFNQERENNLDIVTWNEHQKWNNHDRGAQKSSSRLKFTVWNFPLKCLLRQIELSNFIFCQRSLKLRIL